MWAARLRAPGIDTAQDLRDSDPGCLRALFTVVMEHLVYELRGVACLGLEELASPKQQIIASRSFAEPVFCSFESPSLSVPRTSAS